MYNIQEDMLDMGFFLEERGQAAIEYLLLVGGVIIVAVVIGTLYSETVRNTGETVIRSVDNITNTTRNKIMGILENF
jgi:uncharacterized protein (UPF0333 family)